MSHGWRTREARELASYADGLGYAPDGLTGCGHLRFVHRDGVRVVAPSKLDGGRLLTQAKALLRRYALPQTGRGREG